MRFGSGTSKVFDVVRIVARCRRRREDRRGCHKQVTGNEGVILAGTFLSGDPEQFLIKRHKIRAALHAAVEEADLRYFAA